MCLSLENIHHRKYLIIMKKVTIQIISIMNVNPSVMLTTKKKQPYRMAICTMIKSEAEYLAEWIEYHLMLHIDHFYFYNDGSTDNMHEVLQPYIDRGIVSIINWRNNRTVPLLLVRLEPPFTFNQRVALADCIYRHQKEADWFGLWDIDEFLVLHDPYKDISQLIKGYVEPNGWDNLQVPMTVFGPSNHDAKPKGLVIENYFLRMNTTYFGMNVMAQKFHGKSFYRSGCALPEVHMGPSLPPNCKAHQLFIVNERDYVGFPAHFNHYSTKSLEEWNIKMKKWNWGPNFDIFTMTSDLCNTYDEEMLQYAEAVKLGIKCFSQQNRM